jgi:hypothetical protein
MAVRLSALRAGRPLLPGTFLLLICVRGWVDHRAIVRLEIFGQLKNPIISRGMKPAKFRYIQCGKLKGCFNDTQAGTTWTASDVNRNVSFTSGKILCLVSNIDHQVMGPTVKGYKSNRKTSRIKILWNSVIMRSTWRGIKKFEVPVRGKWLASRPSGFNLRGTETTGAHRTGSWVGPSDGRCEQERISCPCPESNSQLLGRPPYSPSL